MDLSVKRIETRIGMTLTAGVLLAGLLVAFGGMLYLLHHAGQPVHYHIFRGEPSDLRTIGGVVYEAMTLSGRGLIQLGLVVLVAVQLVRVALAAWLFVVQRDRVYAWIALAILAVLAYSLFRKG